MRKDAEGPSDPGRREALRKLTVLGGGLFVGGFIAIAIGHEIDDSSINARFVFDPDQPMEKDKNPELIISSEQDEIAQGVYLAGSVVLGAGMGILISVHTFND